MSKRKKVIYAYCKRCDLTVTHDRIFGVYICRACGCGNDEAKEIIPLRERKEGVTQ